MIRVERRRATGTTITDAGRYVKFDCSVKARKAALRPEMPAGQLDWLVPNCYERLTPETVEQFKHVPSHRTHYYKVCDGVRYTMTPEEIERLKTALRCRKETEMPTPDYFSRYRKPKIGRMPWDLTAKAPMVKVTDLLKKETPHLMTPQEVKDRLAAGEDPLLLSIEHWVQNAAWIKEHGSLPSGSSTVATCALCRLHRPSVTISPKTCPACPLGISQGRACDARSKPATAWRQFFFDPSYANAMNMVAVLASLKPPEAAIPQFYIDGEGEGKVALRLVQRADGRIVLQASTDCDFWWCLLDINQSGATVLPCNISRSTGLDLDDRRRLRLEV